MREQNFNRHKYSLKKELKTLSHYERVKSRYYPSPHLTDLIKLEKNRGYNRADNVHNFIYAKKGKYWDKKIISGLIPTPSPNIFYGDIIGLDFFNKKTKIKLLVFVLSNDKKTMIIDEYDFYPTSTYELRHILHKYLERTKEVNGE